MTMQPDLLAATEDDLRDEVSRHGGGTPPRFLAPAEELHERDDEEYYSPVQYAEAINRRERDRGVVSIKVVPFDRIVEYADRMGML